MPLFRKKSSALMELEGMDRQPSSELSPSPGVLDELRRDQPLRSSMHLVPEAHEADGVGDELVRVSSAKRAASKLASKKRQRALATHRESAEEAGSPTPGTDAAPGTPGTPGTPVTPVPDLHRMSMRTFAVAVTPRPEQYAELPQRELRDMQANAAVAGMTRSRAVWFNNKADWLLWVRNEHPLLSCFISHPLHPFDRLAHIKFLSVVVLFGVFSSVMTLHNLCRGLPPDQECEHSWTDWRYARQVMVFALCSMSLQLLMQTMAVCSCLQPGGCCYSRHGCLVCCTNVGSEGLMVLQAATAVLVVVAILVGIQDPHISLGATLRTTMHTKMLAFLGSFVVLTVKFMLYKKWQRKYWEPTLEGTPSSETSSTYLHVGLPTKDFLILTDYKLLRGLVLWLAKGFAHADDPLRHAGLVIEASTPSAPEEPAQSPQRT